jgi:hypothetical protein
VFEFDKKIYAIEIETGKVITNNKKQLIAKVFYLNKNYGKNWFFVLTDKNFVPKYSKFGQCFTKLNIAKNLKELLKISP